MRPPQAAGDPLATQAFPLGANPYAPAYDYSAQPAYPGYTYTYRLLHMCIPATRTTTRTTIMGGIIAAILGPGTGHRSTSVLPRRLLWLPIPVLRLSLSLLLRWPRLLRRPRVLRGPRVLWRAELQRIRGARFLRRSQRRVQLLWRRRETGHVCECLGPWWQFRRALRGPRALNSARRGRCPVSPGSPPRPTPFFCRGADNCPPEP